jgi:predicted phosphodiesterase
MVKNIYKKIILIILSAVFIFACSNDFAGFVASNDLDERLISKNDFPFLDARNWRDVSFGSEYNFIVVTDTHMEDGDDFGLKELPKAIQKHNAKFAVNIGDITQHGTEHDVDMFIEIADSLGVPFYPTIGNHDIYFGTWSVWRNKIGSTNYRIDIKDNNGKKHTSLLFLDSANAFLGRKQLDWLEFELKKDLPDNVFVFTHAAFFTTGIKMQQLTDTRERARAADILKNKADIMFMGHSHQRAINEAGNVRYVTFEDFKTTSIYIVVEVKSSGVSYKFDKL